MKKEKNFEVVTFGSPDISALSESEQKTFYVTLLAKILQLYKEKKQQKEG